MIHLDDAMLQADCRIEIITSQCRIHRLDVWSSNSILLILICRCRMRFNLWGRFQESELYRCMFRMGGHVLFVFFFIHFFFGSYCFF